MLAMAACPACPACRPGFPRLVPPTSLLACSCSQWTGLTQLDLNHVMLHTCSGALEAAAALPCLQSATLSFDAPPNAGGWQLLRQLGGKLSTLRLSLLAPDSEDEAWEEQEWDEEEEEPLEPPPAAPQQWIAEALQLTQCGAVELFLNSEDASYHGSGGWRSGALAGIERLPALRSVTIIADAPLELWACGQLTHLFMQKTFHVSAPGSTSCQLSSLQCLDLLWCSFWQGRFPAALYGLPALTSLQIHESKLSCIPPQVSELRCALGLAKCGGC